MQGYGVKASPELLRSCTIPVVHTFRFQKNKRRQNIWRKKGVGLVLQTTKEKVYK